ncbi:MAG: pilus assembly protein PilF, partial [Comamonadaceae bacterium]|nr:pilus assembly protein PilF [Comamonadaceae bacterium]
MNHSLHRRYVQLQIRALVLFGQRQRALEKVDQVLAFSPSDAHALATRAHLLAELGDKSGAQQSLRTLVTIQAEQPAAWFNLGYLSEEMGH